LFSRTTENIQTHKEDIKPGACEACRGVVGVRNGLPMLEDGRVLDVRNIIWCTGFHTGFSWIDLPIFDEYGEPRHEAGVVASPPGLYFVGLHYLYALSSEMIH
jgi:putative flavoprotein involved in K+ transport